MPDAANSPCIDTGDPGSSYSQEPFWNGNNIDMGAYGNTPQASKSVDSDGDGLSDTMEIYRLGTNPYNPDTDGDGASDGQEYLAGTSPLDKNDFLGIVKEGVTNGTPYILWSAKSNKTYQVIESLDLRAWTNALTGAGGDQQSLQTAVTNGVLRYVQPGAATNGNDNLFFRIRLVL